MTVFNTLYATVKALYFDCVNTLYATVKALYFGPNHYTYIIGYSRKFDMSIRQRGVMSKSTVTGVSDHALPVLNHDRTDHNSKLMVITGA